MVIIRITYYEVNRNLQTILRTFSFVFFFFLFSNLLEFFFEDTDKMILLFIAQKLTLCQSRIRVRSIQIFNKTIAGWIFYNLKSKIYSVREYFDDDISTNN